MSTDTTTKKPDLKPLEVGVGAGAAVITAFASSYLGTAGTLSGAAVASVVGTVSTSVLRASAARSTERVRETTARLRQTHPGSVPRPTDVRPVGSGSDPGGPDGTPLPVPPDSGAGGRRPGRRQLVLLGAGAVIAFAAALVLITGIESAAGKPLAGLVGKETGGGTTIGRATGTDSGSGGETRPSPTPAATTSTTGEPTAEPSATEPTPEPSAPTGAPSATAPTATAPPTATTNPLTSESPRSAP